MKFVTEELRIGGRLIGEVTFDISPSDGIMAAWLNGEEVARPTVDMFVAAYGLERLIQKAGFYYQDACRIAKRAREHAMIEGEGA